MTTDDYVALAGVGAIASAVISVVATVAGFIAANAAKRAAVQAAHQERESSVREAYRDANRASVTATWVGELADTVKKVKSNVLIGAGQSAGSGMDKVISDHEELLKRTKEITDYALNLLTSEPATHSDDQLTTIQRRLDGHIAQLEAIKERLLTDLELARTGMTSPHAAVNEAAKLRETFRSHGSE